jgi:hypothetical protein
VDEEPSAAIGDFAVDRTFDDDIGAGFDGQAAKEIAAHMERAVSLHDGVAGHRAMKLRRAGDQQRPSVRGWSGNRCGDLFDDGMFGKPLGRLLSARC